MGRRRGAVGGAGDARPALRRTGGRGWLPRRRFQARGAVALRTGYLQIHPEVLAVAPPRGLAQLVVAAADLLLEGLRVRLWVDLPRAEAQLLPGERLEDERGHPALGAAAGHDAEGEQVHERELRRRVAGRHLGDVRGELAAHAVLRLVGEAGEQLGHRGREGQVRAVDLVLELVPLGAGEHGPLERGAQALAQLRQRGVAAREGAGVSAVRRRVARRALLIEPLGIGPDLGAEDEREGILVAREAEVDTALARHRLHEERRRSGRRRRGRRGPP